MRYELSDYEWGVIMPMLPNKPRGIPRVDDRRILNGIFLGPAPQAPPGAICRRGMDLPRLATIASFDLDRDHPDGMAGGGNRDPLAIGATAFSAPQRSAAASSARSKFVDAFTATSPVLAVRSR